MLRAPVLNPLDAVARLTASVSVAPTLDAIFSATLDGLRDHLAVDRASLLLFDPDKVMRFKAWRGLSAEYRSAVEGHTPWTSGQGAPAPIVVGNVHQDTSLAPFAAVFAAERISTLAFFPLVSARGVIGKFMLYGSEPDAFTDDHVHAASALGFVIGFAIERTQRVDEAERQHQRLLFALDAASMGTWEWDVRTQEVRWSENLERIHGLPPGTFTGAFESYQREIHPDDRERVLGSLQRALREDTPHDVEYRIVAPDGTVRWVHGRGRLERDHQGAPARMSGVCMDISVRRRIESENERLFLETQRLLAQEEALRTKLTTLTNGSFRLLTTVGKTAVIGEVLTLATQVVTADAYAVWTRAGEEWSVAASEGLSREFTAARMAHDQRYFPFDRPIVAADLQSAAVLPSRAAAFRREGIQSLVSVPLAVRGLPTGSIVFYYRSPHQPSEGELQVTVALGHLAAAAISNAELHDEQQRLRQNAEAAETRAAFLAEASARLSSLDYEDNLRSIAHLAVSRLCDWCAVDLQHEDGTLVRVATAHVDPAKIALAEDLLRRYPPDLSQPGGLGQVLRTGEPALYADVPDQLLVDSAVDATHLRILREVGIASAMIVPLATGSSVMGTISFVNSAARRFDRADLAFATELGRRAALAIENARLYTAAQAANRLKDEFLATLSHELRTPLNVIAGRARMLVQMGRTPAVRDTADVIDRNAGTLTKLVDDLLDVSRMTIGQIRLERQVVNVAATIAAAVQAVQATADAKGVTIVTDLPPGLRVIGDPVRIQQITWNLLTNSVKFTPAGGAVHVSGSPEGDSVVLAVRDSGNGIPAQALPRVFEMFWQAESSSERQHGGLGLGLSIVKRLAELHGGSVRAASDGPGKGAVFTVVLPAAEHAAS